jgi:uncharacterized membrane protein
MKTGSLVARLLAAAILLFTFAVSVYRAKTQTIAHDEALTYEWFLDQGVEHVLHYNPANHILQTLMAKPIVKFFGVTEFKFRLPSLFGAAVYLVAVYLLCRQLFGEGLVFLLTVAMLAWNPQVRDFMAAARGYSLGLAGLAVAMFVMARLAGRGEFDAKEKEWRWGCAIASISLALAVAANLTNVVPAACLTLTFGLVELGGPAGLLRLRDPRVRGFAKYFLFPGAATGFCLLWPYLIQARVAQTTIHLENPVAALRDIFNASFLYSWTDDFLNDLGAAKLAPVTWQMRASDFGVYVLLPLLFLFALLGLALAMRTSAAERRSQRAQCQIFAGAAVGSVVLTVALHFLTKVDYPNNRYCLFAIPLFTIGGVLSAQEISARIPSRILKGCGILISAAVVFVYAQSLDARTFRYNKYDAISRELYDAIDRDAHSRGLTNVRVGGTWWYEPEINFYRLRFRATWMQEYEIKDKSYWWNTPNSLRPADYDYFVFIPVSDPGLSGPRIRTIYHDAHTQATIIAIARE